MDGFLEKACLDFSDKLGFHLGREFSVPVIPPEHVYFSLTNRCNLRCQMCEVSRSPSSKEEELSTAQVKDIILQTKGMGIRHLIFSGGEPLLREDLTEILGFAIAQGISMVDIITNGMLLDDSVIEKLVLLGLNHMTISLDGMREANDAIRGEGVFEKASLNIDKINSLKSKHRSRFPTVGINFTIMDRNIDDILPMIGFARSKGCNIVVFQPVLFNNIKMYEKSKSALWVSKENTAKLKKIMAKVIKLKRISRDLYIYTDTQVLEALPGYFSGDRPEGDFKCYEGIKRIVITCIGTLWNCLGVYGDLRTQKLEEAWFSSEAQRLRQENKRCQEHCLQDCVYFPSDINCELTNVLARIKGASRLERRALKDMLLRRIEEYQGMLSADNDRGGSERQRLEEMRKKITNTGGFFHWW